MHTAVHIWTDLTVLWIAFCLTGPIWLSLDGLELRCVRPSLSLCPQKVFSDFGLISFVGRPRSDMRTSVTWTRSKVKVTELPKLRKWHFSRSVSSAVLAWSSKLMVGGDSMGPGLQLVGARFSNFLLRKLSREFKLVECRYFTKFKWPYFGSAWGYSQMVGRADRPKRIVHADVILTRSKINVKVTGLLNFQKLPKIALFYVYLLRHLHVELKTDGWSR